MHPLDRGSEHNGYQEAYLCLNYALQAYHQLTLAGHEAFLITSGSYSERHEWINRHGIELYLACHLNAGQGNYSLVEYSHDASQKTAIIAHLMAKNFQRLLNTSAAKVVKLFSGERGITCINNTRPPALILEPLFIDNQVHFLTAINKPELIAQAITDTVKQIISDCGQ